MRVRLFITWNQDKSIDLDRDFLNQVEDVLSELNLKYNEITTWTTDGFFRRHA